MKHFLLARELPALFALAMAGGIVAAYRGQLAAALWLAAASLWTLALWLILFIGGKHESRQRTPCPVD